MTQPTGVRIQASVRADVLSHVILRCSSISTIGASKRFLSSMGTNVFGHVVFPNCGIRTVGTLMHLAASPSPAIPRTITEQSHLSGTPILITVITKKIFIMMKITHNKLCIRHFSHYKKRTLQNESISHQNNIE